MMKRSLEKIAGLGGGAIVEPVYGRRVILFRGKVCGGSGGHWREREYLPCSFSGS